MVNIRKENTVSVMLLITWVCIPVNPTRSRAQTIEPSAHWKNSINFQDDSFFARGISKESARWVKFSILLEPYDPTLVYYQNCRIYVFHFEAASEMFEPFMGMTTQQFNRVTLFEENQQAILGSVILPPLDWTTREPEYNEYGIQFVRQDAFSKEEIRDLFNLVKQTVNASPDVKAFYFPTYEQQGTALESLDWLESNGIPLSSTARWAKGNTCYSQGWALGKLTFVTAGDIEEAYHTGLLKPTDVLLTDGIPAELPYVAGILSLVPSTPNSHVAILARTYGIPFVHLALEDDAERALALQDTRIVYSAFDDPYGACDVRLIDTESLLDETIVSEILKLKRPNPLVLSPMATLGAFGVSTIGLEPSDIRYVGGKASNYGILREALPSHSPNAMAFTFDLWNAFLDQSLLSGPALVLDPGEHMLFWADNDPEQGSTHADFRLSSKGESIALFARDGQTLIDSITYPSQTEDISYGRSSHGSEVWQAFDTPTPGHVNAAGPVAGTSNLVINEFMASNKSTIEDPCNPGSHPDWIELYNGTEHAITLNGLYLTDDVNDPTQWQIPEGTAGETLREEIAHRLLPYQSYPPADMLQLSSDLGTVRRLFTHSDITPFNDDLREEVITHLTNPNAGFDPNAMLRFRSSTNVEDSEDFVGAGLYDSYSGCLADSLASNTNAPCACDPNSDSQRTVFRAIRKTFSSFYNDNAFLERLRHDVNEANVGMSLLVHHSFPDELELANGVATIEIPNPPANTVVTLVSQLGATSVTNPQDASMPEEVVVEVLPSGSMVPPKLQRASNIVPLGSTVMTWRDDYQTLSNLLLQVSDQFSLTTGKTSFVLDLEYKKMAPGDQTRPAGGLIIKQVREIPTPDETPSETPFLINIPLDLEIYTGEFIMFEQADVFANHRLKSRWSLATQNMALDSASLTQSLYGPMAVNYLDADTTGTMADDMASLPSAAHGVNSKHAFDTWQLPDLSNPRSYTLRTTEIPTAVSQAENPILSLADLGTHAANVPIRCLTLDVSYATPVTSWNQHTGFGESNLQSTTSNRVYLWPREAPREDDMFQERHYVSSGITITTSFYYPKAPSGFAQWTDNAGATAPLKHWNQTTIEGLAPEPIVLKGYFSQTYRPEHHNEIEHFLFEPRLEPDLSDDVLEALKKQDVRLIHLIMDNLDTGQSNITIYGMGTL